MFMSAALYPIYIPLRLRLSLKKIPNFGRPLRTTPMPPGASVAFLFRRGFVGARQDGSGPASRHDGGLPD